MRNKTRWLSALLAAGMLYAVLPDREVEAQPEPPPPSATVKAKEGEALRLDDDDKHLSARRIAEEILAEDPSSIAAHYVKGRALFLEEGSLPNALYHLQRALSLFEARHGSNPSPSAPWELHRKIMLNMVWVTSGMEDYDALFDTIDRFERLYEPRLLGERAWAEMKLRNFDKARALAEEALQSSYDWQQGQGRNTLCAIAAEERLRERSYEDCTAAYRSAKTRYQDEPEDMGARSDMIVDSFNAAFSAFGVLKYDEGEQLLTAATKVSAATMTNPWHALALLYLSQGRLPEALQALKAMQRWRNFTPPDLREQNRADLDATLAYALLVTGETEVGMRVINRAVEHPDRRANTSALPEQTWAGHSLLRRAMRRAAVSQAAEHASARGLGARLYEAARAQAESFGNWYDSERVLSALDDEVLIATLRTELGGGLDTQSWMVGDLIELAGPGVIAAALAEARARETVPGFSAFFDGFEAEIQLAWGDEDAALTKARASLAALPPKAKLFAARVAAIGAQAALALGDQQAAIELFGAVLQADPGTLRRLDIALPAHVTSSSDPIAQEAAMRLGSSPRLQYARWGFSVDVEGSGDALQVCLRTPAGNQISCARPLPRQSAPGEAAPVEEDGAAALLDAFHAQVFSIAVGTSIYDLRSLDGTPAAANEIMREKMRDLLQEMGNDE